MKKQVRYGILFLVVCGFKLSGHEHPEGQEVVSLRFILPRDSFKQDGFDRQLVEARMPEELVFENVPRSLSAGDREQLARMVLRRLLGESGERSLSESERRAIFLFDVRSGSPIRVVFRSRALVNRMYEAWQRDREAALLDNALQQLAVNK